MSWQVSGELTRGCGAQSRHPRGGEPIDQGANALNGQRLGLPHGARDRGRLRRAGSRTRLPLTVVDLGTSYDFEEIMALDEALRSLEERDPRAAEVVELRFFAGLSFEEIAEALGTSVRTAKRDWTVARAWLHARLGPASREET